MKARIVLEDGTVLEGEGFGADTTVCGEIVFNTGMTGYQEILTDPSYAGQIVTMTYPLIGNYGINDEDIESDKVQVSGFVVKEYSEVPNHWQCKKTLDSYLKENNILGVSGIDTRMLTKKIREKGTMKCMITTKDVTEDMLTELNSYNFPMDIVKQVSRKKILHFSNNGKRIAVIDLGLKKGIIKQLTNLDCDVTVFPHNATSKELLVGDFNAILFSNGPGDPKDAKEAIETAKNLLGVKPLWGICLGHQVLALALGADTYKLKFGHRGSNHPVIELETGKVFISSQNHGYAVKNDTLTDDMDITYLNVNDDTVEGIQCNKHNVISVQFHPEEGPGPEDAHYLFKKWVNRLD